MLSPVAEYVSKSGPLEDILAHLLSFGTEE